MAREFEHVALRLSRLRRALVVRLAFLVLGRMLTLIYLGHNTQN